MATKDEEELLRSVALQNAKSILTVRLRAEQELLEAKEALERKTAELARTSTELAMARDAALEASRAKSNFLANMSHELRTPLNAIIGYAELLQDEVRDLHKEELAQDLGKIHEAGNHLLSLINDILDLARIEAGKMNVSVSEVDVPLLVQEVVALTSPLFAQNHNSITVDVQPGVESMETDEPKLRQVLYNLLSNAAKFTMNGQVHVYVALLNNPADQFKFCVSDTGIGIDPADLNRLFRDFSQIDSSSTRKHGGTGLGLAISRRFCKMLGGEIYVESSKGGGSIFSVHIPRILQVE